MASMARSGFQLPNFTRQLSNHLVGFDDFFDIIDRVATLPAELVKFPPRNLIKHDENTWEVQFAVAGFTRDDLKVSIKNDITLVVEGSNAPKIPDTSEYMVHGIAARSFKHEITIPKNANLDVNLTDGILSVRIEKPVLQPVDPTFLEIK
jgi:molecular chaperone IbpA